MLSSHCDNRMSPDNDDPRQVNAPTPPRPAASEATQSARATLGASRRPSSSYPSLVRCTPSSSHIPGAPYSIGNLDVRVGKSPSSHSTLSTDKSEPMRAERVHHKARGCRCSARARHDLVAISPQPRRHLATISSPSHRHLVQARGERADSTPQPLLCLGRGSMARVLAIPMRPLRRGSGCEVHLRLSRRSTARAGT